MVNGHTIYSLVKNRPIVIEIPTNPSRVVVTDGFHITRPLVLNNNSNNTHFFKIACVIQDDQLFVGLIIIALLYAMGSTSGMVLLQLVSMIPIFYFLFLYYVKRREFIQVHPA